MAVQNSFYNFTLLCRAALPCLAGDVAVAVTLAAFRAGRVSEPSVSYLQTNTNKLHFENFNIFNYSFLWKKQNKNPFEHLEHTYRLILSILISTPTLAERNTFVSREDKTRVTDASFHAGLVAGATWACRVLTTWLGACRGASVVMTAWGALQSWREHDICAKGCKYDTQYISFHQFTQKESKYYRKTII